MKITEKELIEIGFVKNVVTPEESGEEDGFYYYTFESCGVVLITPASNDVVDHEWSVEFFDTLSPIKIMDKEYLLTLTRVLLNIEGENKI